MNSCSKFEKSRARLAILNELLSFPTIRGKDWVSTYGETKAAVGDLVALDCAPVSEWYLSWVIEIDATTNPGWARWALESVDTGRQCWWQNVGISIYKGKHGIPAEWRWTDRQFQLRDRWYRVMNREDAYLTRPAQFEFGSDGSLVVGVRERHNFGGDNFNYSKTFPDWRKVTIAQLTDFYHEGDKARDSRKILKSA